MCSSAMFSLALVAAAAIPAVISIPLVDRQSTPPMIDAVSPALNQTTDDLTDGFLSSLSTEQLQDLSNIVGPVLNDTLLPTPPKPTSPTNSSGDVDDLNQPEKRDYLGFLGKIGTEVVNDSDAVGSAVKRAPAPPPHLGRPWAELDEPEKRDIKGFFKKVGQGIKSIFG